MQNLTARHTIAAISTPPGRGAVGIIRVSGEGAFSAVSAIFKGKDPATVPSHTLHFGTIRDKGEVVDEVVVSVFHGPNSFTGEDVVEISCHGSPQILQRVMELLLNSGVQHAKPGEFTMRAFLNGKMDLSQAEAVADLIAAESEASRKSALYQMRGGFSKQIRELRTRLLDFASLIELELDFSEEDVEFANRRELYTLLTHIRSALQTLTTSFHQGNVIKKGVSVVIAGRPNSGKSTLLNKLLNEERALVSEIPGTTRDTVEDTITIEGIAFRFIDTAGIHATDDRIEKMGIQRTLENIRKAHLVIYLFDVNELDEDALTADIKLIPDDKPRLIAGNKTDLSPNVNHADKFSAYQSAIFISTEKGTALELLKSRLISAMQLDEQTMDESLVTNIRHFEALQKALSAVEEVISAMDQNQLTDLLTIDIRKALHELGEITGEITSDEILGNIFSKFCIGK